MSQYECSLLAQRYQQGRCNGVLPPAYMKRPVIWIGPSCPAPCAETARKKGVNPAKYCAKIGKHPTWQDGGCKLANNCLIYCEQTCKNQPNCKWFGPTNKNAQNVGLCKPKSEYEG